MKKTVFITKKELCSYWGITTESLRLWLKDPDCRKELQETGYRDTQKQLTPKQLEILRKHFE